MPKKSYLTDAQWSNIFVFFKNQKGIYIKNDVSLRTFIDSIFWIMRTGAQWRELPEQYGKWNSVFQRFNAWSKKGIWHLLLEHFSSDSDMESVMIDSTILRAHACAAGYQKDSAQEQALGRSRGGFTSKIHALVDALGNPIKFVFTGGNSSDIASAPALIEGIRNSNIIADKAYDSNDFILDILNQECSPVIPPKKNRLLQRDYDKHVYKERHLVECFFGKIKHFRRIFSRFDKSIRNFASFLCLASTHVWIR